MRRVEIHGYKASDCARPENEINRVLPPQIEEIASMYAKDKRLTSDDLQRWIFLASELFDYDRAILDGKKPHEAGPGYMLMDATDLALGGVIWARLAETSYDGMDATPQNTVTRRLRSAALVAGRVVVAAGRWLFSVSLASPLDIAYVAPVPCRDVVLVPGTTVRAYSRTSLDGYELRGTSWEPWHLF